MEILGDFDTTVKKALSEIHKDWEQFSGLIVCGSHTPKNPEYIIERIKKNREKGLPFLGICYGHQLAAIENERDCLPYRMATSEEWGEEPFVIKKRDKLKVGVHNGESWWSNYYVDGYYTYPDNYVVVPYHPEYQSSKKNPHKDLVKFINICRLNAGGRPL